MSESEMRAGEVVPAQDGVRFGRTGRRPGAAASRSKTRKASLPPPKNFETFGRVVNTSASGLMATARITEAGALAFRAIGQASLQMLRNAAFEGSTLRCMEKFTSYLIARLQNERVEVVLAIFLDGGGHIIAEEEIARGTVNRVDVYPREIIRRCLELDAIHIILVHNHPGGPAKPSAKDMMFTRDVLKVAELMDIYLVDHIVVGGGTYFSMYKERLLA